MASYGPAKTATLTMLAEQQPQVAERVLDLLSLKEGARLHHLVADALPQQLALERHRLRVGAVQHRHRRRASPTTTTIANAIAIAIAIATAAIAVALIAAAATVAASSV